MRSGIAPGANGKAAPAKPLRLGEAMRSFLRVSGLKHRRVDADLARVWAGAVGTELARRSRLQGIAANRVLTVEVDSPAVRQELSTFRKTEVLAKLRAELPDRPGKDLRVVMAGARR